MDGLSPEAEEEMKARYATLSEEMSRYQGQYYQVMNQAQMKLVQGVGSSVQEASEIVAKNKKLSMIMNKEACFFTNATLDVTSLVIAEMDKQFETTSDK
jgi:outer membrane protein